MFFLGLETLILGKWELHLLWLHFKWKRIYSLISLFFKIVLSFCSLLWIKRILKHLLISRNTHLYCASICFFLQSHSPCPSFPLVLCLWLHQHHPTNISQLSSVLLYSQHYTLSFSSIFAANDDYLSPGLCGRFLTLINDFSSLSWIVLLVFNKYEQNRIIQGLFFPPNCCNRDVNSV